MRPTTTKRLKNIGVPASTHRKLLRIKAARRWNFGDFIDMAADKELAAIQSESRQTPASSEHGDLVAPL